MTKTITWGMHLHDRVLFEPLTDPIEVRIAYVREHKPANEVETRLGVMRALTAEEATRLPQAYIAACNAVDTADNVYQVARDDTRVALDAFDLALAAYEVAQDAFGKSITDTTPELEALHKEFCMADCTWNGMTLVFPVTEVLS